MVLTSHSHPESHHLMLHGLGPQLPPPRDLSSWERRGTGCFPGARLPPVSEEAQRKSSTLEREATLYPCSSGQQLLLRALSPPLKRNPKACPQAPRRDLSPTRHRLAHCGGGPPPRFQIGKLRHREVANSTGHPVQGREASSPRLRGGLPPPGSLRMRLAQGAFFN